MSAKWRRNKKRSNWFKILETMKRGKNKKAPRTFRLRNCETKKRTRPNKLPLMKIHGDKNWKEPERLIDVLQEKDEIIVVADVAGFKKENLKIQVKNQRLVLSAETSDRKYYKSLNLPLGVIPNKIRSACRNGVLEIRLKRAMEKKAVGNVVG